MTHGRGLHAGRAPCLTVIAHPGHVVGVGKVVVELNHQMLLGAAIGRDGLALEARLALKAVFLTQSLDAPQFAHPLGTPLDELAVLADVLLLQNLKRMQFLQIANPVFGS